MLSKRCPGIRLLADAGYREITSDAYRILSSCLLLFPPGRKLRRSSAPFISTLGLECILDKEIDILRDTETETAVSVSARFWGIALMLHRAPLQAAQRLGKASPRAGKLSIRSG